MFTMLTQNTRKTFSAVAAMAIVSFGGLVMDQAYLAAAPKGTIEVGDLTTVDGAALIAQLPEVIVVARRDGVRQFAAAELPEVVVVAKRVTQMVASDDRAARLSQLAIKAGF